MSTKNNGKRYKDDFKSMVVDLYHSGNSVKDLSSEYGVSDVTNYKMDALFIRFSMPLNFP